MISGIAIIDISDHLPTFCIVDIPVQKQKFKRYFRDYRRFESELYLQDIKATDGNSIYIESNVLNHLKTVSKKVYYCKQFNLHRNNLKATWKLIGTLIKRKTKES